MLAVLKKQLPSSLLMAFILIVGAVYLFQGTMSRYPAYVHAWTQSDRIAIAQNFQQNGFDFFHPATYNLLTKDGITQVDFPIHRVIELSSNAAVYLGLRYQAFLSLLV